MQASRCVKQLLSIVIFCLCFYVPEDLLSQLSNQLMFLSAHQILHLSSWNILSCSPHPLQLPGTGSVATTVLWLFYSSHSLLPLKSNKWYLYISMSLSIWVDNLVSMQQKLGISRSSSSQKSAMTEQEQELSFMPCYQDELLSSLILVCYLRRQGFNRQNEGTGNINTSQQRANGSPNHSPTAFSPTMLPLNQSSSFPPNTGPSSDNVANNVEQPITAEPTKFFFREKYAKLGVKGNFMPLAAQPANVDLADWLAHQSL